MSTLSYYAKLFVIRKVTIHKGNELLVWARFYGQLRRVRCALSFRTYLEKLSYIKKMSGAEEKSRYLLLHRGNALNIYGMPIRNTEPVCSVHLEICVITDITACLVQL